MTIVKSKFPNRYFILKRITQNVEQWQTCCIERGYVVINDESYAKKLQNCYEVIKLPWDPLTPSRFLKTFT